MQHDLTYQAAYQMPKYRYRERSCVFMDLPVMTMAINCMFLMQTIKTMRLNNAIKPGKPNNINSSSWQLYFDIYAQK